MASPIQTLWEGLDFRQRVIAGLSVLAILATMYGISRIATTPAMSLLYSGLESNAAGQVIAELEKQSVAFEVRGNSIYVDGAKRDRLRLDLAAKDLPAGGPAGYEILDGLSGFGTTSQMFDAAYWRAKEGELARTIASAPNVRTARVHIANPVSQPFARDAAGSASVTVAMNSGALGEDQGHAIRYMVASAIAGIDPNNVAVIDAARGVVLSGDEDDLAKAGMARNTERAELLRRNISRLLEAHVGTGKAIVEVNVDTNTDSQTISSRVIDPDSRIAISSETEESKEESAGASPGVTVASNLPDGDVAGGTGENNRTSSQVRERQNFEVSVTQSERVILPGQVQKIAVAVMVDGTTEVDDAGNETWTPRTDEELDTLKQLVEAAIGFDKERGDTVTIKSLQFTPPVDAEGLEDLPANGIMQQYGGRIMQLGVLAAIVLALIFFVLRPMVSRPVVADMTALTGPQPDPADALEEEDAEPLAQLELPELSVNKIDRLREVISSRSEDSAAVLRAWIEAPEEEKEAARS